MKNNILKISDKSIIKIVKKGLIFSLFFSLVATILLFAYIFVSFPSIFYVGLSLLKSSLFFAVAFTIFGFAFDYRTKVA